MSYASIARPIVIAFLFFSITINCQNNGWGKFWDPNAAATVSVTADPLAACKAAVAGDAFSMICVPPNTTGFIRGSDAMGGSASPQHIVASITAFAMGKYEVKYDEWEVVRLWGIGNAYTFANNGAQGGGGGTTNQHPATSMNWRDMYVWCNAASEKAGLTPVYYTDAGFTAPYRVSVAGVIVSTPGAKDNPYVKWSANGYRLPTDAEWEYAARYIDGTTYLPGDRASGATAATSSFAATDAVAWFGNIINGTTGNTTSTRPVGTKAPNALGLYDMSGNVFELVWDWVGGYSNSSPFTDADSKGSPTPTWGRVVRGGGWNGAIATTPSAEHGGGTDPNAPDGGRGFRVVRRP